MANIWEIRSSDGAMVGTVEQDGENYTTNITGVKTSAPAQTFKGRGVLVDYLDWLAPGWSAEVVGDARR